jgi:hypothetical protein
VSGPTQQQRVDFHDRGDHDLALDASCPLCIASGGMNRVPRLIVSVTVMVPGSTYREAILRDPTSAQISATVMTFLHETSHTGEGVSVAVQRFTDEHRAPLLYTLNAMDEGR